MTPEEEILAQQMEDQSPTQNTVVDDSVFAYNDNPLQKLAAQQQPPVVPPVAAPAVATPPVVTQPAQSNILAANAPYVPNRESEFEVTPEGAKLGIIQENGTIGHVNQSVRPKEQWDALYDHFSKRYKSNREPKTEAERRSFVTQAFKADHDAGLITDNYEKSGYIKRKGAQAAPTQAAPAPKTATDLVEEAARTGKSYLQLYQENMPKPEYEQERADRIQTNSKASIIADILKLVGEGVTTKKGGTPIVRQSAVPMLNAELQKLNDLYKNEVRAYKQGGFNALLMDEQEKKRALIQKARDEAAKAVKQMEIDAAAKKDEANKKADADKLDKQQKFTATQNELNRRNTLVAAQKRAENGGGKGDRDKNIFLSVNGKSVPMPESIVNEISANYKEKVIPGTKGSSMTPKEIAQKEWNKYYDYVNGEFVPKSVGTSTAITGSRASRASQSSAPRSRASN